MFLTAVLLRNRIPGRQWIGKHRRPRSVSWHAKQGVLRRLEIEAENQYWLSAPYLTPQQELGHAAARRARNFQLICSAAASRFPAHRLLSDQLAQLQVTKKWR